MLRASKFSTRRQRERRTTTLTHTHSAFRDQYAGPVKVQNHKEKPTQEFTMILRGNTKFHRQGICQSEKHYFLQLDSVLLLTQSSLALEKGEPNKNGTGTAWICETAVYSNRKVSKITKSPFQLRPTFQSLQLRPFVRKSLPKDM